jgi:hypothetical protein
LSANVLVADILLTLRVKLVEIAEGYASEERLGTTDLEG